MSSSAPVVAVQQLRKSYGQLVALNGIDFEIHPGEVFALLGPNGAGKSTCIEILEGLRHRSGGQVSVLGHDPQAHSSVLKERLGFVSQESGVELTHTPRELLRTYGFCYARRRDPDELLALVGLEAKADAKLAQLSGGQKRRMDLALGLVGNPEVLFLDEPTTGFSPEARRETWRILLELKQSGMTILLTSHYMDEVSVLADRMAILVHGEIAFLGAPESLGHAQTLLEFTLPAGWLAAEFERWLAELPPNLAVAGQQPGAAAAPAAASGKVVLATGNPTELLYELTKTAKARQVELVDLTVSKPTLEDSYLQLLASHGEAATDAAQAGHAAEQGP